MKAVLLDADSLGSDIDLSPLREQLESLEVHPTSTPAQARERLAGADIAIVNKVVLDADTLNALPSLRHICVLATGTNISTWRWRRSVVSASTTSTPTGPPVSPSIP